MTFPALLLALTLQVGPMPPLYRPSEPRIQRLVYDPNQVVPLAVAQGYAAVIDLGPDQQVESVVVGNSAGWEVTASKRGDHVVVKPLASATTTDMIVITGDRRYVFLIQASEGGASFVVSFSPDRTPIPLALVGPAAATAPSPFEFHGDKALFPAAMRSDGQRTIITWGKATALPAVFAVENGHESIVNGRMFGSDYIIEGNATRYVFRIGKAHALAVRAKSARRR